MFLANLLNAEQGVLALHEGKIRDSEESKEQHLPFLTLENFQAYSKPESAEDIFRSKRADVLGVAASLGVQAIGDIAYNNSPFVGVIPKVFPNARLIVLTRDGRDFVRSVYTSDRPDPTPVGWLDEDTELTDLERYIAFGRLRPLPADPLHERWSGLTPIQKNAWLWAETYQLIYNELATWDKEQLLIVRAEDLFGDPTGVYARIRDFLGFNWSQGPEVESLLSRTINKRSGSNSYILPHYSEWDGDLKAQFDEFAGTTMQLLGYAD